MGDGYGRRIEFDQVYWSKSKGDPLNKPTGQINLEIPEMTENTVFLQKWKTSQT